MGYSAIVNQLMGPQLDTWRTAQRQAAANASTRWKTLGHSVAADGLAGATVSRNIVRPVTLLCLGPVPGEALQMPEGRQRDRAFGLKDSTQRFVEKGGAWGFVTKVCATAVIPGVAGAAGAMVGAVTTAAAAPWRETRHEDIATGSGDQASRFARYSLKASAALTLGARYLGNAVAGLALFVSMALSTAIGGSVGFVRGLRRGLDPHWVPQRAEAKARHRQEATRRFLASLEAKPQSAYI